MSQSYANYASSSQKLVKASSAYKDIPGVKRRNKISLKEGIDLQQDWR